MKPLTFSEIRISLYFESPYKAKPNDCKMPALAFAIDLSVWDVFRITRNVQRSDLIANLSIGIYLLRHCLVTLS